MGTGSPGVKHLAVIAARAIASLAAGDQRRGASAVEVHGHLRAELDEHATADSGSASACTVVATSSIRARTRRYPVHSPSGGSSSTTPMRTPFPGAGTATNAGPRSPGRRSPGRGSSGGLCAAGSARGRRLRTSADGATLETNAVEGEQPRPDQNRRNDLQAPRGQELKVAGHQPAAQLAQSKGRRGRRHEARGSGCTSFGGGRLRGVECALNTHG